MYNLLSCSFVSLRNLEHAPKKNAAHSFQLSVFAWKKVKYILSVIVLSVSWDGLSTFESRPFNQAALVPKQSKTKK